MSFFAVTTKCFVAGIEVQAIGPAKDGSWAVTVSRTNFVEEPQLGETIKTITLIPQALLDSKKACPLRSVVSIPENCTSVSVTVGISLMITDEPPEEFLGMEIRDIGPGTPSINECFKIAEL